MRISYSLCIHETILGFLIGCIVWLLQKLRSMCQHVIKDHWANLRRMSTSFRLKQQ